MSKQEEKTLIKKNSTLKNVAIAGAVGIGGLVLINSFSSSSNSSSAGSEAKPLQVIREFVSQPITETFQRVSSGAGDTIRDSINKTSNSVGRSINNAVKEVGGSVDSGLVNFATGVAGGTPRKSFIDKTIPERVSSNFKVLNDVVTDSATRTAQRALNLPTKGASNKFKDSSISQRWKSNAKAISSAVRGLF